MSINTLKTMLEAQGTFPNREVVLASFDNLLSQAAQETESPEDLAWALLLGLHQLSNVDSQLDASLAQRLHQWVVANWTSPPPELCKRLCIILVNVASPESLQFMKDQSEQSSDELTQSILTQYIQAHPLSADEGQAE